MQNQWPNDEPECDPNVAPDTLDVPGAWRLRIGVANVTQRDAVENLRRRAYRGAAQFEWNDEATLGWTADDDTGTVLALWDAHGALLSTTRASVFSHVAHAQAFLEYSLEGIDPPTPMLVISRVATLPEAARSGLFALLRYAYLSALPATAVRSLIAVVYEGAAHSASMRECGYEFFEPRAGWDTEARARTRPMLAVLAQAQFAHALQARAAALAGKTADVLIDTAAIAAAINAQWAPAAMSDDATPGAPSSLEPPPTRMHRQ